MIPKLHKKGTSFQGAANYVLHDKGRARTSERVAWVETQNLATRNPDTAWRVMAATAMDQGRLKAAAGIKATGRKSNEHVLHFTLSWHADEAGRLSQQEMLLAARGAIAALGGGDRQAMIVAHKDEPQPHVHVVLNRVSSTDGRMLSSSKEKLALSKWAETYERGRGEILCHERVVNNQARKRGEYTRGRADRPRHIIEREANDNRPAGLQLRKEQRAKDPVVSRQQRETKRRHKAARLALIDAHQKRVRDIREAGRLAIIAARQKVRDRIKPAWLDMQKRHQDELNTFNTRERSFLGRMTNRLKAIPLKAIVRGELQQSALTEGLRSIASAGARLDQVKQRQAAEQRRLLARQRAEEMTQDRKVRAEERRSIGAAATAFVIDRAELGLQERMDHAATRAAWKQRQVDRFNAWQKHEQERPAQDRKEGVSAEIDRETFRRDRERVRRPHRPRSGREDRDDRGR